jgi:3-oxoacyl-[acyl-carrier protein] reductase
MTRECLPLLEAAATKESPAHVINIGSIAGITGQAVPTYSYDASKAAVHHLTKKLASDLAPSNICVNAIAPGLIRSAMTEAMPQRIWDAKLAEVPMGRAGEPSEVAAVALFLASDLSSYMTGTVLEVTGGRHL